MNEVLWAALGAGLTALLTKLVGKWIDRDNEHIQHGKSLRDELRDEIARLEKNINNLNDKVDHLEAEVEEWKVKVDEWRHKYFTLFEEHQLLKIAAAAKDNVIKKLKEELERLQGMKLFIPGEAAAKALEAEASCDEEEITDGAGS